MFASYKVILNGVKMNAAPLHDSYILIVETMLPHLLYLDIDYSQNRVVQKRTRVLRDQVAKNGTSTWFALYDCYILGPSRRCSYKTRRCKQLMSKYNNKRKLTCEFVLTSAIMSPVWTFQSLICPFLSLLPLANTCDCHGQNVTTCNVSYVKVRTQIQHLFSGNA